MKRNAINQLIEWKDSENHQPIWISGIKGVGKTFLALDFAKSFYEGNLYVNFETNAAIRSLVQKECISVEHDYNIIELLCLHFHIPNEYIGNLLFIFDEIGSCPEAVIMLCDLVRAGSNVPIIVIASETVEHEEDLFTELRMYPMEFDEYLIAEGNEWYTEVIKGHYQTSRKVPEIVHKELLNSFEDYLLVGGMPAAVNDFITMEGNQNISEVHQNIYRTLIERAMKQLNESDALKISQVFDVMTTQLMKENKKFQYRFIRKGATYALYKDAIAYLVDNSYLYKCTKNTYDKAEDEADNDTLQFKLFLPDVGILNTLIGMKEEFLFVDENLRQKTIIENYMMQSLTARGYTPNFWESNSLAKIDFLIKTSDGIVPIEAKINENSRGKSIGIFKSTHDTPYSIRVSSRNFEFTNHVKNIPYYAIFCLK